MISANFIERSVRLQSKRDYSTRDLCGLFIENYNQTHIPGSGSSSSENTSITPDGSDYLITLYNCASEQEVLLTPLRLMKHSVESKASNSEAAFNSDNTIGSVIVRNVTQSKISENYYNNNQRLSYRVVPIREWATEKAIEMQSEGSVSTEAIAMQFDLTMTSLQVSSIILHKRVTKINLFTFAELALLP